MNEIESRKRQKSVIIDVLKTLPVKLVIVKQIEGDSLIAYVAKHFTDRNKTVTIVSNDKDFYQLLDHDNIKIFNPHKKSYIAKCNMEEVFPIKNFPISSYRLYKAIRGDNSDNIKGIKLFGDKKIQTMFDMMKTKPTNVAELYQEFANNEVLFKKYWKYFDGQRDLLELNYQLIDLIDMDWSPQSLSLIYAAIESHPSFSRMDFMQLLIRENINTILSKVDKYIEPFNRMLPVKT